MQLLNTYIEIVTELLEIKDVIDEKSVDDGGDIKYELVVCLGRNDMLLTIHALQRFCLFPNRLNVIQLYGTTVQINTNRQFEQKISQIFC